MEKVTPRKTPRKGRSKGVPASPVKGGSNMHQLRHFPADYSHIPSKYNFSKKIPKKKGKASASKRPNNKPISINPEAANPLSQGKNGGKPIAPYNDDGFINTGLSKASTNMNTLIPKANNNGRPGANSNTMPSDKYRASGRDSDEFDDYVDKPI